MKQRAIKLLALAGALASSAVVAAEPAPPAPPAPKGGFNLYDAFMEGCIDPGPGVDAAAKALEAKGAKRMPRAKDDGIVQWDWSSRGPRLMVSLQDGMCVMSTNAADRDLSMRAFLAERPKDSSARLPRADSGLPDEFTYLAGFQMRTQGPSGGTIVIDALAYQDDRPNPVLSMAVAVRAAAKDEPPPAPPVPPVPLATAADVAAVFD